VNNLSSQCGIPRVRLALLLKRLHPNSSIPMSGISASYYHEERVREPAVDFVLPGDSTEEPCRQLLQALPVGAASRVVG